MRVRDRRNHKETRARHTLWNIKQVEKEGPASKQMCKLRANFWKVSCFLYTCEPVCILCLSLSLSLSLTHTHNILILAHTHTHTHVLCSLSAQMEASRLSSNKRRKHLARLIKSTLSSFCTWQHLLSVNEAVSLHTHTH